MNGQTKQFVPSRVAQEKLRVHAATLRVWDAKGYINTVVTPGGHRLYDISSFVNNRVKEKDPCPDQETRQRICYCRVSSAGQRDDLQRQVAYMQSQYPTHRVVTDIGSGINFNRRGLKAILELSSKGLVEEVVVAYRDRLCRFAFELINWMFHIHGTKLVVLNETMESSESSELATDLLAIVNVFNCRINGRRKYKQKDKNKETKEENVEDCVIEETSNQHLQGNQIETSIS